MKSFFLLFLLSILLLSCKNSEENKDVFKPTFKSELTEAITNTYWVHLDFDNNFSVIVSFLKNGRFGINAFEGVNGPEILNIKGSWHIENDYIKSKYDSQVSYKKWTINNDFSKIINNEGVAYTIVEDIQLNLEDLKRKYKYLDNKEVAENESTPQNILNKIISITGNFTQGKSEMGYVEGTSDIYLKGKHLKVDYSALGENATETGSLEGLKLVDGPDKSSAITGKWMRDAGGTGDFYLAINDTKPNSVICKVYNKGGGWLHFKTKKMSNQQFEKVSKLLSYKQDNSSQNSFSNTEPNNSIPKDNIFIEGNLNYQIQVKNGVKNVNVRDSYMIEQSKVITRISSPENYTVTKETTIKDRSKVIYMLKIKSTLTDTKSGHTYIIEPGKKVKLLTIKDQFYNAEITVDNKTINVNIPLQNVEAQYDQKWVFLKELNGWVLDKFVQRMDDKKIAKTKNKSTENIKITKNNNGTITIGNQTWSNEDLQVTKYNNGDPIFEAKTEMQWEEAGKNKKGCYRRLGNGTHIYNGFALKDERGILPTGFSAPTKSDFETLYTNLGGGNNTSGKATKRLISYSFITMEEDLVNGGIIDVTINGNNTSGFNAQPGGFVYGQGRSEEGNCNFWWTKTQETNETMVVFSIGFCSTDLGLQYENLPLSYGSAIRAIKKK